MVGVC